MALDLAVAPGGLACGRDHACFVTIDSGVWCLGDNRYDQLGFDTGGAYTLIPGRVPGIDAVSTLNAGDRHTCATRSDGSLWCWGTNAFLGLSMTPTQVDIALP
jgi:alpha-tubulin suppressor-like RCC1 family protein